MSIECVTFRVLVKPDSILEKDERYQAAKRIGIEIVGKQAEREQAAVDRGRVVNFGPTVFREYGCDNPIKIGDQIVYARHAGKEIEDPETDEKFICINDEDIVAILRSE